MILPDKIIKIDDALLYKALMLYHKGDLIVTKKMDITLLTILYAIKYIDYEIVQSINMKGEVTSEIKISKIK